MTNKNVDETRCFGWLSLPLPDPLRHNHIIIIPNLVNKKINYDVYEKFVKTVWFCIMDQIILWCHCISRQVVKDGTVLGSNKID